MNKRVKKEVESSVEYVLFDYMGDVRRIMCVSARAVPAASFINEGGFQHSGNVIYDVTYVDAEGKLVAFSASSDYDMAAAAPEGAFDVHAVSSVSNVSLRLLGPRKMLLKCNVSADVTLAAEEGERSLGDAFELGEPERATERVFSEYGVWGESEEKRYSEVAQHLDGVLSDEIEILTTSGSVRILESVAVDGGIKVRGEISVTSIIKTPDEPPFAIRRIIPFEQVVAIEGVDEATKTTAEGYITSASAILTSDDDGGTSVEQAASVILLAQGYTNREVSVLSDAYLKNRDTESTYEEAEYTKLVDIAEREETVTLRIPRSELGLESVENIIYLTAELAPTSAVADSNGIKIEGNIAISGIACQISEENTLEYVQIKYTEPMANHVELDFDLASRTFDVRGLVVACDYSFAEDQLLVKCTLKFTATVRENQKVKRLCECRVMGESEYKSSASVITVYYPEAGDTLFEVAKKFHTTPLKLAVDNSISEGVAATPSAKNSLDGIKRLVIR